MTAVLLLSLAAAVVRVNLARKYVSMKEINQLLERHSGEILDRTGLTLYDGAEATDVRTTGTLIGGTNTNLNTIVHRYEEKMLPGGLGLLSGIQALEDKQYRQIQTTLLGRGARQAIADAFQGKHGCCYAYNYVTGEIYAMISLPSAVNDTGDLDDASMAFKNRCLTADAQYAPGSTMKIVTSICALEQSVQLDHINCTGKTFLPDEDSGEYGYTCAGNAAHGDVDMTTAIGKSCNGYFASLIQHLDNTRTKEILQKLGFTVNAAAPSVKLGELDRCTSSVYFSNNRVHNDVWTLIGEQRVTVSVVDMARIAGAVANGGEAADPFVVKAVYDPNTGKNTLSAKTRTERLFSKKTAQKLESVWSEAVETYYRGGANQCDPKITLAKTGTTESPGNKLLLGVCEESTTAFMIVVENYQNGDPLPAQIANVLVNYLP